MTVEVLVVLAVLILVFISFIRERFTPDITAMLGVSALLLTGVLEPNEFLSAFSNPAPITVAATTAISRRIGWAAPRVIGDTMPGSRPQDPTAVEHRDRARLPR